MSTGFVLWVLTVVAIVVAMTIEVVKARNVARRHRESKTVLGDLGKTIESMHCRRFGHPPAHMNGWFPKSKKQ